MSGENDQERNLPATPRRLEKAREEGQVARSSELATAAVVTVTAGALWMAGPGWMASALNLVGAGLRLRREEVFSEAALGERLMSLSMEGLMLAAPLFGLLALAGIGAMMAIGGWLFTTASLEPKAERLSPLAWGKRTFSVAGLGELVKTVLKTLGFVAIAVWFVWTQRETASNFALTALPGALTGVGRMAVGMLAVMAGVALLIAALDVPFVMWRFADNLKMSLEEIKREAKESEGDPHVKGRIRQLQREASRRRMMSEVPKADVVVTNPTHYAVALSYRDGEMRAPRVVAKGTDLVAAKIRELAAASGVPLLEAPPLARALHKHAEIGDEIPAALYSAVAQVLAWVFELRRAGATAGARMPQAPVALELPAGMDPAEGVTA
jgi:flagellar biosynthetic protein FlhB